MIKPSNWENLRPDSGEPGRCLMPGKAEIGDQLEEVNGPLAKRQKSSELLQQQGVDAGKLLSKDADANLFEEPSPLGLRLRKSPSLLDLIQMRLSQAGSSSASFTLSCENHEQGIKDLKSTAVSGSTDKMKASNFPASLLRIGTWERASKHEGDLVAKCYFAKHKLVWEVLEGGLKSKIEIQWPDIIALKATLPENGPGTLDIMLARPPLFFKETNPQPRKHTLWQATSDFTGGQASRHRRHSLQCPQGFLNKHFEKLIQCDPRLNALCQLQEIAVESPYFEPQFSVFECKDESKCKGFGPKFSECHDPLSCSAAPSASVKFEVGETIHRAPDNVLREYPSPSTDTCSAKQNSCSETEQDSKGPIIQSDELNFPALEPSISMSEYVSEQMESHNPPHFYDAPARKNTLEELTQHLLSESQISSSSDEKMLMSRVNSLSCLLHKNPIIAQSQQANSTNTPVVGDGNDAKSSSFQGLSVEAKPLLEISTVEVDTNDASPLKWTPPSISRKDSSGDLLLHLPRVASLPHFFCNFKEDGKNQAR